MLISYNLSSLVIDTLRERDVEKNARVAYFYFDFAAKEGQSTDAVLGSVLRQIIGGKEIPEGITTAFRRQKEFPGDKRLELPAIVKFLQDITYSRPTFICIDSLDECQEEHRTELLNSLNNILKNSPQARLFLTGRDHILPEVKKHLGERAVTRSIKPTENDMATFLKEKLDKDKRPEAMNENLKKDIMQKLPKAVSGM